MKKALKIVIGNIFLICILLGLGYLGLAFYYQNGFSFLTYINGVYCTGKSVETVNMELNESFEYDGLKVIAKEGSFDILAEDILYSYDYREPLKHYLTKQNPYLWIENLKSGSKEYTLQPAVCYDETLLNKKVQEGINTLNLEKEHKVILETGEDGFILKDTKQGILDTAKAENVVKQALLQGLEEISLEEYDCYYDKEYTDKELELIHFYNDLNEYQSKSVTYLFGCDKEILSKQDLAKTLVCYKFFEDRNTVDNIEYKNDFYDEEGLLLIDEEAISTLLDERFTAYNTYQNHTFTTHDGRTLQIKGGTYGNKISMKTEKQELASFLESDDNTFTREPVYTKEVSIKGKNDIGDTYIEVDIGKQKMFYYRKGELYLETDVVTGKNNATREEVCYVYAKQKNRILRGPGYESFVKYWMPVSGGIGIHDASWRSEFGGEIYIRNGSHGCVNTPLEIVEQMYEVMEVGTPCILYYGIEEDEKTE